MKCLCVWKEPVVQSVLSCVLCVLGVNISVSGGQAQKCMLCCQVRGCRSGWGGTLLVDKNIIMQE